MFASTVLSSIYESIVSLFKSNKVAYIESLEYQLNQSKQYTDFLSAENDVLKEQNEKYSYWSHRYKDFYDRNSDIHVDIATMKEEWNHKENKLNNLNRELSKKNEDLKTVNALISRELTALGNDELKSENIELKKQIDHLEEQLDVFIDDGVMAQLEEDCGCNSNVITVDINEYGKLQADSQELKKAQDRILSLELDNQCLSYTLDNQQGIPA